MPDYSIEVSKELLDDLKTLADLKQLPLKELVDDILNNEIDMYRDPKAGKIQTTDGFLAPSAYERKVAENEGSECRKPEPCHILYQTTMFGSEYYALFDKDGHFLKAPADCVTVKEKSAEKRTSKAGLSL